MLWNILNNFVVLFQLITSILCMYFLRNPTSDRNGGGDVGNLSTLRTRQLFRGAHGKSGASDIYCRRFLG